jgi:hypothetical protein
VAGPVTAPQAGINTPEGKVTYRSSKDRSEQSEHKGTANIFVPVGVERLVSSIKNREPLNFLDALNLHIDQDNCKSRVQNGEKGHVPGLTVLLLHNGVGFFQEGNPL